MESLAYETNDSTISFPQDFHNQKGTEKVKVFSLETRDFQVYRLKLLSSSFKISILFLFKGISFLTF